MDIVVTIQNGMMIEQAFSAKNRPGSSRGKPFAPIKALCKLE